MYKKSNIFNSSFDVKVRNLHISLTNCNVYHGKVSALQVYPLHPPSITGHPKPGSYDLENSDLPQNKCQSGIFVCAITLCNYYKTESCNSSKPEKYKCSVYAVILKWVIIISNNNWNGLHQLRVTWMPPSH